MLGTAYLLDDEEEPSRGRLVVLSVAGSSGAGAGRRLQLAASRDVNGGVFQVLPGERTLMERAGLVGYPLMAVAIAGALASGTVYASTGLELDLGNTVAYTPLLSSDRIDISQREVTGSAMFDLTAANEVSFMATVKANTTQGLGLTIGTAAGNKIIIHAPAVQLINPSKGELNGTRLIGYDLRLVPTAGGSGNDELRIVTQ